MSVMYVDAYISSTGRAMRFKILAVAQVINLILEHIHGSKSIGYITIAVVTLIFGRIFTKRNIEKNI